MIRFTKVRWKNFLSTGNHFNEITLDNHSITLGIGKNGSGKSAFIDAICFALFGKAFRNINLPSLVNSINEKDAIVEIEFTTKNKSYLVRRGLNPRLFEIYRDGKMLDQHAKAKDSQKFLEESILGMNYRTFVQIVILGSSSFVPFMQLPLNARRLVIEDLLDIQVFSVMNSILKRRISDAKEKRQQTETSIRIVGEKIKIHEKHVQDTMDTVGKKHAAIDSDIAAAQTCITTLNEKRTELVSTIDKTIQLVAGLDVLKNTANKLNQLKTGIERRQKNITRTIDLVKEVNTCPTCSQEILSPDDIITTKSTQLDEICTGLDQLNSRRKTIESQIQEKLEHQEKVADLQKEVQEIDFQARSKSSFIETLQKQKQDLLAESARHDEYKRNLEDLVKSKSDLDAIILEHEDAIRDLNVTGEFLCDTGVKSKIVQYYLPVMNKLINKHLDSLGFSVQFELDENFNEVIRSRYRDVFSYFNFSEGEKFRIDIALLLSWREIAKLKNSVNTNLLILDEIGDSSLDEGGYDALVDILADESVKNKNNNVFIISHRASNNSEKFSRVLEFSKVGEFSTVQEVT